MLLTDSAQCPPLDPTPRGSCLVFGLWLLSKKNHFAGGAAVGVSMVMKLLTLPLGVWFVAKRNFKAVAGIISGGILGLFFPAIILGWRQNLFYLEYWLGNIILDEEQRGRHWALNINFSLQAMHFNSTPTKYSTPCQIISDVFCSDGNLSSKINLFGFNSLYSHMWIFVLSLMFSPTGLIG